MGDFPTTETKIDFTSMPKAEQEMHMKAREILNKWQTELDMVSAKSKEDPSFLDTLPNISLSSADMAIVEKSGQFLRLRILELFRFIITTGFTDWMKYIFEIRLAWFLEQLFLQAKQERREKAIFERKALSDEQLTTELKKLEKDWIIPWTPATWRKFRKKG